MSPARAAALERRGARLMGVSAVLASLIAPLILGEIPGVFAGVAVIVAFRPPPAGRSSIR